MESSSLLKLLPYNDDDSDSPEEEEEELKLVSPC
jgi:hypothetical protein